MTKYFIILLVILTSCSGSDNIDVNDLEGYWEIYQVEKEGKIIKEYTISLNIDYFKIKDDTSGFKKKVAPQLDGSFLVSKAISDFKLKKSDDNSLHVIYNNKNFNADEVIKVLSKSNLELLNSEGLLFKYKRFEKFDLLNE